MKNQNLNYLSLGKKTGFSDVVVRNIITERNKPSFDFIEAITRTFDWINIDWLITGNGEMIKSKESDSKVSEPKVHYGKCQNCSALEKEINRLQTELIELKDELLEVYRPKKEKKTAFNVAIIS